MDETDLKHLSKDDYRLLLSEQFETHRRLCEQAQSVIRTVIAGTGIIIALLGYKLYPNFQVPSRTLSIAGGAVEFQGMLQNIGENSLFVAALFGLTSFGLLFSAVVKSIGVLTKDSPVPLSRHKTLHRDASSKFQDGAEGKLIEWILTNDSRLVDAEREVEQSYIHIWAAFGMGAVALFLTVAALLGSLTLMGLTHTVLVIIGPLVAIYYVKDTTIQFVKTLRSDGFRLAFSAAGDIFHDTMEHRGLDSTMKVTLILFYGIYFRHSLNIATLWLVLFVF